MMISRYLEPEPVDPPSPNPRPTPRLSGGGVWSTLTAEIERDRQTVRVPNPWSPDPGGEAA